MNITKIDGLVNRKQVISTLEDKANITGFRWTRPQKIPKGVIENRSKKGDFLYYSFTENVNILDVNETEKATIKETYYKKDKQTIHKQATVGVWVEGLAGKYHGRNSRNWQQESLTLPEIIDILNAGNAFAPGLFAPPAGKSARSGDFCEERLIILLDGDEWSEQHPDPANFDEMLCRYPDLATDFYWIGESISSRSSLKPELRCRLMLVLTETDLQGTIGTMANGC